MTDHVFRHNDDVEVLLCDLARLQGGSLECGARGIGILRNMSGPVTAMGLSGDSWGPNCFLNP
jgi:hypothetical protein